MGLISFGVWGKNFRREKQGRWMWSQWQITECEAMKWGWATRMDSEKEDQAMDQKSLCGWSELGAPPRELKDNFCARKYEKALRRLETQTKYWVNMAIKSFSWMPSKALRRNKQTKETKPKNNDFIQRNTNMIIAFLFPSDQCWWVCVCVRMYFYASCC